VSRNKRLLALIAAALAALSLGLAACGDDSSSNDTTTEAAAPATTAPATTAPATPTPTAPATTSPAPAAAPISVEADPTGQLAFVEKTLTAPAGKDTFKFTNDAPVPHDFAIKNGGGELGVTDQISNGETADLTVTLKAGDYTFYCTVPGHEAAGMKGTLTVN
jgi:uncharacterized cupredoxin-like copper-binding protein